jgi:hypothetical protein
MSLPELARRKSSTGRTYVHPVTGQSYPSVTTITGMKDKPALMQWAVNETTEYAIREWDTLTPMTKKMKRMLLKGARYESRAPGTDFTPANAGDLVHDLVESYCRNGVPSFSSYALGICEKADVDPGDAMDQVLPWFGNFLAWERRFKPVWVLNEATVFNHTVGYAGTMDLLFRIGDKHHLCDVKSGKGAYPDTAFQLEALARGEEVVTRDGTVTALPHVDQISILHLTPKVADWIQIRPDQRDRTWDGFRALANVQNWEIEHSHLQFGTIVTTVAEIPES